MSDHDDQSDHMSYLFKLLYDGKPIKASQAWGKVSKPLPETPLACNEAEADTPAADIEADNAAFLRSFGVRV